MPELAWIKEWLRDRVPEAAIGDGDSILSAGILDSLGFIDLIEGIERRFGVAFRESDFLNYENFSPEGLARIIAAKRSIAAEARP